MFGSPCLDPPQCITSLSLSSLRNELLAEYPDLAEELEEELRRMDAENREFQAQAELLQQQLSETKETADEGGGEGRVDAAFVPSKTRKASGGAAVGGDVGADDLIISEEEEIAHDTDHDGATVATTAVNDDVIENHGIAEEGNTSTSPGTDLESSDGSRKKDDFTLAHLAVETLRAFLKQAHDDAKQIFGLVMPLFTSLLDAGDVAFRQLKALFVRARETYEAAKQKGPADQQDETADAA
jgi:hypothetical protein